jgi:hypothetical protein
MAISNSRRPSPRPSFLQSLFVPTPRKKPAPSVGPTQLFTDKKPLSRPGFRQILRKDSGKIPETMRKYSFKERESIEKNVFEYRKYGTHISGQDYKRVVGDLDKKRAISKSFVEKKQIKDRISYLKGLNGERK